MTGMHDGFVGQGEQLGDQRVHDFFHGAAPQVSSPDASGKQRVTGEKDRMRQSDFAGVGGKKQARAARTVAGRMDYLRLQVAHCSVSPSRRNWCTSVMGGVSMPRKPA